MRWTNTISTAADFEQAQAKGQWKIGDAIIRDLKENNVLDKSGELGRAQTEIFSECSEALRAKGIEHNGKGYETGYVRSLFLTAFNFPAADRNLKFSWDTHCEAGTPETLKKAATALRKIGKTITKYNVRDLVGHWVEEADRTRRTTVKDAKSKKDTAKAKKAKAAEDALKAKTTAEREEALTRRKAAQREIKEATATILEAGSAPPFNPDLVDTEDTSALQRWAIYMGILAHTERMKTEAKKALADVTRMVADLSDGEREHIEEGCKEVITIVDKINALVKRQPTLSSIKGGKSA
jgi:hypothetical protein